MRRDTKAIEAAARAIYTHVMATIDRPSPPWDRVVEGERIYWRLQAIAGVDVRDSHLAEHGDDEGRKWKLVPVDEPTQEMWQAYRDTLFGGQGIYEDAGGFMMRTLKAWLMGKKPPCNDVVTYKKILAAAPSITGDEGC